jgi:N-acyl-D-aspartate/D-glutamate deacylase
LEEAHYKLSFVPAWVAGFKDRGCVREGLAADLMIYDLEKLGVKELEVANDIPPNNNTRLVQRPTGYRWIMCNGEVTFENGRATGANPGELLRCSDVR